MNLRYFDDVILVMIAISSLSLAIEDPVEPFGQSERNKVREIKTVPASLCGQRIDRLFNKINT